MSDKVIKLNNDPVIIMAFVEKLRTRMEKAPAFEEDDREFAISVVDDIKTMCQLVCDSIVDEEGTSEHPTIVPLMGMPGPKS